jgi:hypothetical protein
MNIKLREFSDLQNDIYSIERKSSGSGLEN